MNTLPSYSLRSATPEDFLFLRNLHRLTMKPYVTAIWGWNEEQQEQLLRERFAPEKFKIIQIENVDVGILQVEERPAEVFLGNIQLLPEVQGKGLGARIVTDVIARANSLRQPVSLTVLRPNPAKRLYERLRFVTIAEDEVRFYMWRDFAGGD
jgi:GNAT superfamily N-acetyltransferase